MRIATTAPNDFMRYEKYEKEGKTKEALSLSTVVEFWLSVVNTFGALYEAEFKSMYSRTDKAKLTTHDAQQCDKVFYASFTGIVPFTTTSLLEEGNVGDRDFFREITRTINGGSSSDN